MNWWIKKPRKSARVLIIENGRLLTFLRKRYSQKTGEWIEYYSIPGGGIDKGESPEEAAKRELLEEMGVEVGLASLVAHRRSSTFEHYIFHGHIRRGTPRLMLDSEEAHFMNEYNQFIVEWVEVSTLTKDKLRYYSDYYELICRLADGERPTEVLQITAP
jgi:8-oxo-dGTP pyrophosphatase MutT (NUDIX family)